MIVYLNENAKLSNRMIAGVSLMCMQCDRRGGWYSPKENEKAIERCQLGLLPPTRCLNASATHCILSYYRKGLESSRSLQVFTSYECLRILCLFLLALPFPILHKQNEVNHSLRLIISSHATVLQTPVAAHL